MRLRATEGVREMYKEKYVYWGFTLMFLLGMSAGILLWTSIERYLELR